jgi:hypothetical protein
LRRRVSVSRLRPGLLRRRNICADSDGASRRRSIRAFAEAPGYERDGEAMARPQSALMG